ALTWGPYPWTAHDSGDFPQKGDQCLIAFSNRRDGWVIAWWPGSNRTIEIVFNVKNYGAKGDNVNDDTAAAQSAITACQAAGGGIVFFPPGTYKLTSPLLITSDKVIIKGAGMGVPFNNVFTRGPTVLFPTNAVAFSGSAVIKVSNGS